MDIVSLLKFTVEIGASDLHLRAGSPPIFRVHGKLVPASDQEPLTADATMQAFEQISDDGTRQQFAANRDLDFSYTLPGASRYRVNASVQRGSISLAFRRIAVAVPTVDELELPEICKTLALKPRGLILVTGPTGSGKSTTLAAMIEHLNQNDTRLIVTVEDPIEFIYRDKRCVITQREIGKDTHSFAAALRAALRQDVDVILVGEMRDPETMAACLTAAETGHLVLSTLHTRGAPTTIDRIIDSFPPHQQSQIRMQLSLTLEAVLSQTLLPRLDAEGRVAAVEVMLANTAIRNLIREGKTHQMASVLQTGGQEGMQTLEQALKELFQRKVISREEASAVANDGEALQTLIKRTDAKSPSPESFLVDDV